jgi:hypothetical protein
MSKVKSEQVHQLIKALSKSEKRFFKVYSGRSGKSSEKKFVKLFDLLDGMKSYDEAKLLKKGKKLSKQQLPNLKAHLYTQLLQSLKICNTAGLIAIRIGEMLDHARILYNKCLYKEAARIIDKAKLLARNNSQPVQLLELLELERQVIRQTVAGKNDERVNQLISEIKAVSQNISSTNIFSNLALKMNTFYVRTGFIRDRNDLIKVNRFFHLNLPKYKEEKLSFTEKMYLYASLVGYYYFIQDFKMGYKYAKKWVGLFEQNPERIRSETEQYIKALNSLLVGQNKLGIYQEFEETHRSLIALKRRKDIEFTENINLNLFKAIYIHEINRHFILGEFKSGTRIVNRLQHELNKMIHLLDHNSVRIFDYKVACLYFGAENYKSALTWLNRIINAPDSDVREDIQAFARILALICHHELGNEELAQYHLRSLYRFLLQRGNITAYFRYILDFLKNLTVETRGKKLILSFQQLKENMRSLENNRYEKRNFYYFDIVSWLESKIQGRPIQDVVKEKKISY